jgi:ABC-type transporter Mla subunit MlaD
MIRSLVIRLVALLLIANGVAGVVAVLVGWSITTRLIEGFREVSTTVASQQAYLAETVHGVAIVVDDAAQATGGLSGSTTRARNAVADASRTANELAATFEQLSLATQVTVFGVRPLEVLAEPFDANADDFRRLGSSLAETGDSLAENVRDVTRVGDDLRSIHSQLHAAATQVESLQTATLIQQGIDGLELGSRLLLGVILFEAVLSALTGLALLMMTWPHRPHPPSR